jgi:hypothetical protein
LEIPAKKQTTMKKRYDVLIHPAASGHSCHKGFEFQESWMKRLCLMFFMPLAAAAIAAGAPAKTHEVLLPAADAGISGGARYYADGDFIGSWKDRKAALQWELTVDEDATAEVELWQSCAPGCGGKFELQIGAQQISGETESTGGWHEYRTMRLGTVALKAGTHVVTLRAGPFKTAPMNVKAVRLAPLKGSAMTYTPPRDMRPLPAVFVVPNFHPASCGWLADWSVERNYCANSYLDHLDRVRDDPSYNFVLSECNNMIAIENFAPGRFEELRQRVREGRVELVNAFFLEPTVSLSGGEALAKMGIEGLRWQQKVMGVRPRYCWAIDTVGIHDQMPQICRLLGLDALVYTRCNRTGKSVFWSESPDGSRILTLVPGGYADFRTVMGAEKKLTEKELRAVEQSIDAKTAQAPPGAPVLFLGGKGDYALAPPRKELPAEFLQQWKEYRPEVPVRFATLSQYLSALRPETHDLPKIRAGTDYLYDSFWIEHPWVKTWYRRDEHALQGAEMLATIASLESDYAYPTQPLYHAWLQMLLNMDRNTLWGSAGGMVFEHETSWDARDRFEWVEKKSSEVSTGALRKLAGAGDGILWFNPLNWDRGDAPLPACGFGPAVDNAEIPRPISLPESIETEYYSARIDGNSGALTSLKLKPSGREMLGGPANVLVTEQWSGRGDPGDFCDIRPKRRRIAGSGDFKTAIKVTETAQAITVEAHSDFHSARRIIRFNKLHPRIEFETEMTDIPNLTVVVAEFPLAGTPAEIRRGIPFGFSRDDGWVQGIVPAVRWSDYATPGKGGIALLDRGLSGREINGNTAVIYLFNAVDKYHGYPNSFLSGKGFHRFEYALLAHEADWAGARVPHTAWEYNCPPVAVPGCAPGEGKSFLETSRNIIVEAMRRDGPDIELRAVEVLGVAGTAEITVNLPHASAVRTDLVGAHAEKLEGSGVYKFPVRPQQIITLRLRTKSPVPEVEPLRQWDELVPAGKQGALHEYLPDKKGHPPKG